MDSQNKIYSRAPENQCLVFKSTSRNNGFSGSDFLQSTSIFIIYLSTSALISSLIPTTQSKSYRLAQSYRRFNNLRVSACRKPLTVRVVRKASLPLIFLTTLPLHPQKLLVRMYFFWFSVGVDLIDRNSFLFKDLRDMEFKCVG